MSLFPRSWPATDEPIMHATIMVAKIIPCGMISSFGLNAGVQRKTNEYMAASNSDCIAPRYKTFLSLKMALDAARKLASREEFSLVSPLFSVHVREIITPPMARNVAAASNGATGPSSISVTR